MFIRTDGGRQFQAELLATTANSRVYRSADAQGAALIAKVAREGRDQALQDEAALLERLQPDRPDAAAVSVRLVQGTKVASPDELRGRTCLILEDEGQSLAEGLPEMFRGEEGASLLAISLLNLVQAASLRGVEALNLAPEHILLRRADGVPVLCGWSHAWGSGTYRGLGEPSLWPEQAPQKVATVLYLWAAALVIVLSDFDARKLPANPIDRTGKLVTWVESLPLSEVRKEVLRSCLAVAPAGRPTTFDAVRRDWVQATVDWPILQEPPTERVNEGQAKVGRWVITHPVIRNLAFGAVFLVGGWMGRIAVEIFT